MIPTDSEAARLATVLGFDPSWLSRPWLPESWFRDRSGISGSSYGYPWLSSTSNRQIKQLTDPHLDFPSIESVLPLDPQTALIDRTVITFDCGNLSYSDWKRYQPEQETLIRLIRALLPKASPRVTKKSITWSDPYVGKVTLLGASGPLFRFQLRAHLNGNQILRGDLVERGAYGCDPRLPEPLAGPIGMWDEADVRTLCQTGRPFASLRTGDNYVDPRLTLLSQPDLSLRCFSLVADRIAYLAGLFSLLAATRYPSYATLCSSYTRIRIDELELDLDCALDRADLFVLRYALPAWVADGLGDLDPASIFPKLRRFDLDDWYRAKLYAKGFLSEILRVEFTWRRARWAKPLNYQALRFHGDQFRSDVLRLFGPQIEKLKPVRDRIGTPSPRRLASHLAALAASRVATDKRDAVHHLVLHLLERGAVVARSDADRALLDRDGVGLVVGEGSGVKRRYRAVGLLAEVVRDLQAAEGVLAAGPDIGPDAQRGGQMFVAARVD